MSSCEKCWHDAGGNADLYSRLVESRRENPCTPEQQAGDDAGYCPKCSRKTIHQHTGECMACGYERVEA